MPIRPGSSSVLRVLMALVAFCLVIAFMHISSAEAQQDADAGAPLAHGAIVKSEFVYETSEIPSCHASTLAFCGQQLVAAWFGGTEEGDPDVGIWLSRVENGAWSTPREVAQGVQADGERFPCWNPVLVHLDQGPLILFYKVGPSPSTWWGMMMHSTDAGGSWSPPVRLPEQIAGPIKNKPVMLPNGRLLCGSSSEDHGWRVHMEWTADQGRTWDRTEPLNNADKVGAIQPTILQHPAGRLQILCRSRGIGKIVEAWSQDQGTTWSELAPTTLPNPNSGIDAVTLRDGRHVLVYNHTRRGRSPLNVAMSPDGQKWLTGAELETEPGEYSYPAVIEGPDGMVHVMYTWQRRRIRHVVLDPAKFPLVEIVDGVWPR